MGKRSNGTRSQSPAMMAQTRTMSMSSIGGNKTESFSGTKSYDFKLGYQDLKAEYKKRSYDRGARVQSYTTKGQV